MAEQEDTDRSTAAPWVPIGAPGHWPAPGPVEDYEALGSTFLGGGGAHTVVMGEVEAEPEPEPDAYPVEWHRLVLLMLGLAAVGGCALIGWQLTHLVGALPHLHLSTGTAGGHFSPDAGRMFAALIAPFAVVVFVLWLIKGR